MDNSAFKCIIDKYKSKSEAVITSKLNGDISDIRLFCERNSMVIESEDLCKVKLEDLYTSFRISLVNTQHLLNKKNNDGYDRCDLLKNIKTDIPNLNKSAVQLLIIYSCVKILENKNNVKTLKSKGVRSSKNNIDKQKIRGICQFCDNELKPDDKICPVCDGENDDGRNSFKPTKDNLMSESNDDISKNLLSVRLNGDEKSLIANGKGSAHKLECINFEGKHKSENVNISRQSSRGNEFIQPVEAKQPVSDKSRSSDMLQNILSENIAGKWQCIQCTLYNSDEKNNCEACFSERDGGKVVTYAESVAEANDKNLSRSGKRGSNRTSLNKDKNDILERSKSNRKPTSAYWECSICKFENQLGTELCGKCENRKVTMPPNSQFIQSAVGDVRVDLQDSTFQKKKSSNTENRSKSKGDKSYRDIILNETKYHSCPNATDDREKITSQNVKYNRKVYQDTECLSEMMSQMGLERKEKETDEGNNSHKSDLQKSINRTTIHKNEQNAGNTQQISNKHEKRKIMSTSHDQNMSEKKKIKPSDSEDKAERHVDNFESKNGLSISKQISATDENSSNKWTCSSCTFQNDASEHFCIVCFTACSDFLIHDEISSAEVDVELPVGTWTCIKCNASNTFDKYICGKCNGEAPFFMKWRCEQCTYNNDILCKKCFACHSNNENLQKCQMCQKNDVNKKYGLICDGCQNLSNQQRKLWKKVINDKQNEPPSGTDSSVQEDYDENDLVVWTCRRRCLFCQKINNFTNDSTNMCQNCFKNLWFCSNTKCGTVNKKAAKHCKKCGLLKDSVISDTAILFVWKDGASKKMWMCTFCNEFNGEQCKTCPSCKNLKFDFSYKKCICNWTNLSIRARCDKCNKKLKKS